MSLANHFTFCLLSTGLMKLQHLFTLVNDEYTLQLRSVKRIKHAQDAHDFLRSIEMNDKESRKYVILDTDAETAKKIIIDHVRDIYMGRRNFHFLLTSLVMDNYWNSQILEFGAVNITGFRILQPNSVEFRHFYNSLHPQSAVDLTDSTTNNNSNNNSINKMDWPGDAEKQVSVSRIRKCSYSCFSRSSLSICFNFTSLVSLLFSLLPSHRQANAALVSIFITLSRCTFTHINPD